MTEESKRRNIGLEVERAEKNRAEAALLHDNGCFETSVSVSYYAVFHMARAILLIEGLEAKTHSGLAHLLRLHFVNTGQLTPELSATLSQLYAQRQDADYDAAARYTREMSDRALSQVDAFLTAGRSILEAAGYR